MRLYPPLPVRQLALAAIPALLMGPFGLTGLCLIVHLWQRRHSRVMRLGRCQSCLSQRNQQRALGLVVGLAGLAGMVFAASHSELLIWLSFGVMGYGTMRWLLALPLPSATELDATLVRLKRVHGEFLADGPRG